MVKLGVEITNMQSEIDRIKSGHCLLVKLANYDEIQTMLWSAAYIVDDLGKIVRKICNDFNIPICIHIEHSKLLIILPKIDPTLLKNFIFAIYSETQLYTNKQLPEAYMNCKIASINFPEASTNAGEIYALLIGMLSTAKDQLYHQEYDPKFHDLEIIKASNKQLNQLRIALAQKTIQFAYQPIFDRKTGHIPYYECLLRFPDEHNNLISVGPIIQKAENKGLINLIDHTVFEMAVGELVNEQNTSLSVNISNIGILDNNLLDMAENLLKKHDVSKRLIVEITETALNEDYERTKLFIDSLHRFGCKFALDDFGSGFTSFKQLQNLPIDIIKIDGSYVRNISSSHHCKYFIETLVKISEDLGIKTVAEYVENGEVAKFLIDIKVDGMQGNFFSPASSKRVP